MTRRFWEPLLLLGLVGLIGLVYLRPQSPAPAPSSSPQATAIPQPRPLPSWAPSPNDGSKLSTEEHLLLRTALQGGEPGSYLVVQDSGVFYGATIVMPGRPAGLKVTSLWRVDPKLGWVQGGETTATVGVPPEPDEIPIELFEAAQIPEAARQKIRSAKWVHL